MGMAAHGRVEVQPTAGAAAYAGGVIVYSITIHGGSATTTLTLRDGGVSGDELMTLAVGSGVVDHVTFPEGLKFATSMWVILAGTAGRAYMTTSSDGFVSVP